MIGNLLEPAEVSLQAVCWWSIVLHSGQSRRTVCGVSLLGSMLGKPTRGSVIALKSAVRHLTETRDIVNKLELDNQVDEHLVKLAGSADRKSQSSCALFIDGAPLNAFSRRQSVIATSSGMAEFSAG